MTSVRASLVLLAVAIAPTLGAQSAATIAARVANAPDGEVRLTYASRPDACGDGRDGIALGHRFYASRSMESYGSWSGFNCTHGPARVALTVQDHQVIALRPQIGGSWNGGGAVLDLGTVPAAQAAAYFISLAPKLAASSHRNPLLAAVLADSTVIAPDLLRIARDGSVPMKTRRRAVSFVGIIGDQSEVAPLVQLARQDAPDVDADDVGPGDSVQGAAVSALAMLRDDLGVPALMDLARNGNEVVRKSAVFWLGQSDAPQARALVRGVIDNARETDAVRSSAIFALGQGGNETPEDAAFLRAAFDRLESPRLKDRVLMTVSQGDDAAGAKWLIDRARDERQPVEVRRKAVFWAGQGHARVSDIVSLYRDVQEPRLKEHVIFVLSQRDEDSATDALMDIARNDADRVMRSKALFWLAQKNDPRVAKMIADIVMH
ncbi:MAG TPA: HEAT repeat domain-containing protein [Gemmatimonadaceae bacterium]|jgi:HEAT repeat protein